MSLLEYEAKHLLKAAGVKVPASVVVASPKDSGSLTLPVVLKSQVPTGGRGKAGGIVIAKDKSSVKKTVESLLKKSIKGFTPHVLLAEEKLTIRRELYLSLVINRQQAAIELIAHTDGGVEVEENDPNSFLRLILEGKPTSIQAEQVAEYFGLETEVFVLEELLMKLYQVFITQDMTLLEINPLVLTAAQELVAGDAKIVLDDAALFRHPEWNFEATPASTQFVTLDAAGTIATIANGAGLAMATVDAVAARGMTPANFLDIGGGATSDSILASFRQIQTFPNIKAIVINIFAGITRCDEVAKAIIEAQAHLPGLPPLLIRLAGTKYQQAQALLEANNIPLLSTLDQAIDAAWELHDA